jgi:membrane protein implicated in regulation of membrane protease activity
MGVLLTIYWLCFGIGLAYVLLAGSLGALSHGLQSFSGHGGDIGHVGGMDSSGGAGDAQGDIGGDASGDIGDSSGDLGSDGGSGGGDMHAGFEGHGGMDAHAGSAGHEAGGGHGHAMVGHHGHAGQMDTAADEGFASYSPLSPLSVMGFLCAFGAAGLLGSVYVAAPWLSLLIAAGGGIVMAVLLWLLIGKLLYSMQGSSEAHAADMLGLEAEVLTPVEKDMSGEIAYILDGTRYTAPARLMGEGRIEQHASVRIRRVEGNTVYVEPRGKLLQ